ncbi:MAG: O-antigen ligase family protein [Endomicrobium sp.]|nr:O-antigen ligase family protein [Endomicrobium sp.]
MLSQVNVRNFDFGNFNFLGFVIVIAFIFSIFSRFLPSFNVYTTVFAFLSVIFVSLFNNFKFNLNKYNVFAILLTKFTIAIIIACLVFATSIFFFKKHKIKTIFSLFFVLNSMLYCYWFFKVDFFSNKILLWKTALFVIKDNFLVGVGFNNYKTVSSAYSFIENVDVSSIDNIFLQVLCENGIFGFILFMLVLIVFFYYVFKKIKENKNFYLSILVACISFLVYNFFNSSAFISTNMLLLFFILAVPIKQNKDIKKRKHKIDAHLLIILFLPFVFALGKPVYANEQYKKGLYYFSNGKYPVAQNFLLILYTTIV